MGVAVTIGRMLSYYEAQRNFFGALRRKFSTLPQRRRNYAQF